MRRLLPTALAATAATVVAVVAALNGDGYQAYILGLLGLTTMVGIGLNMLMGLTGQLSIGHSGFYAMGAYIGALATTSLSLPFWPGLVAAGLAAGVVGAALSFPASRLSGPYMAMVTIAFAFVMEHGIKEWEAVTGGSSGIARIPNITLFGSELATAGTAAVIMVFAALSLAAFALLKYSRWGLAMRAVGASEVAARSLGLAVAAARTLAFSLGAALTGLAGAFYGPLTGFISPRSFPLTESIIFVFVVMAGGTGSVLGPLAGAAIVVLAPEFLAGFEAYRLMFLGLVMLTVLLIAPRGIVGSVARLMPHRRMQPQDEVDFDIDAFLGQRRGWALAVQNLSVRFGGVQAANSVSFEATPGSVTSLIGPNGAGKTTVLNMIAGLHAPDEGEVFLGDQAVTGLATHRLARHGLARTFQTAQLFDELSVLDNVRVGLLAGRPRLSTRPYATHRADSPDVERVRGLLDFVGYRGSLDQPAADLTPIDRRLVELARALALRPAILLLDEPAAGLNREETRAMAALIRRLGDTGLTVVLVEHDMELVMGISERVVVLDSGQVIADDVPATVQQDPAVRAAYLGEGEITGLTRERSWRGENDSLLNVTGISAGYGGTAVIEDVGFHLHSGEMIAVLGANGAGKTTLMRAIAGLLSPTAGRVELRGEDVTGRAAYKLAQAGVVLVPEGRQVFPELSVHDNLLLGAYGCQSGLDTAELEAVFERFPVLRERANQRAGYLSGGEAQMLAIGRGLLARPAVLLLDEPSLGLAPSVIEGLYRDLARLRDEGSTIVLVDQMAELALALADRGLVMGSGHVVASGSAESLAGDGSLAAAYLGQQH